MSDTVLTVDMCGVGPRFLFPYFIIVETTILRGFFRPQNHMNTEQTSYDELQSEIYEMANCSIE